MSLQMSIASDVSTDEDESVCGEEGDPIGQWGIIAQACEIRNRFKIVWFVSNQASIFRYGLWFAERRHTLSALSRKKKNVGCILLWHYPIGPVRRGGTKQYYFRPSLGRHAPDAGAHVDHRCMCQVRIERANAAQIVSVSWDRARPAYGSRVESPSPRAFPHCFTRTSTPTVIT